MAESEKKLGLSEWLAWMEQCHPAEIELGLARIRQVAEALAIDLSQSQVVTVGGTNGKGTTISYLKTIYLNAGYSVGCYTSPHFIDYNERVQLNGQNASDEMLCDAFEQIDQARGQIPLTYFEYGTLAALLIFSQQKPDLVLLEVGLGGRLDAVNIIDADVSVVTTVALDHIDWLGDNREVIGFEKAGIYRQGKPAVCGDLSPPTTIAETAADKGADLYQAGKQFSYTESVESWSWQGRSAAGEPLVFDRLPRPDLPLQNASTALQVCQLLPLSLLEEQIITGITQAQLTGRMQQMESQGINFCLDVAHNPEAATLLAKRMQQMPGGCHLVLGMLSDKDCEQVVQLLEPQANSITLVDLNVPRGQKAEVLAGYCSQPKKLTQAPSVAEAIQQIKTDSNPAQNVIIAGSFFTVSDALIALGREG